MFSVNLTKIPSLEIGNSDVIFHIQKDGEKLGNLRVSQGKIVWTPANRQLSYWLSWDYFGKIAEAKGEKRKAIY